MKKKIMIFIMKTFMCTSSWGSSDVYPKPVYTKKLHHIRVTII